MKTRIHPLNGMALLGFLCVGWLVIPISSTAQTDLPKKVDPMNAFESYLVGRNIPDDLKQLESQGNIAEAEQWIDKRLSQKTSRAESSILTIERERLRRLRRDFAVTPEEMLEKIQKDIPDATAEDLEGWQKDRDIQWLPIDGEIRFFRREPSNLYRFNIDARKRRDAARPKTEEAPTTSTGDVSAANGKGFTVNSHVAALLQAAATSESPEVLPVRVRARHTLRVKPDKVPPGQTIRCWIPFPQEYRQQGDIRFIASTPVDHLIAPNGSVHRTIYLAQPAPPKGEEAVFTVEYEYTCSGYVPSIDPNAVKPTPKDDPLLRPFLEEELPHVPITKEIRDLAEQIVGDETNPYLKADKIFRWINDEIRYASEMEYAVMPSVVDKVMATRKGDCGVHVLIFVALCRAVDVPARWQSGWATRPGSWNIHDWAEFYVAPYGWLPADPSFGLRASENPQIRDFYIGHLDTYRMIANQGFDKPFTPAKLHWRSDPVDNQRGEVEWEGGNLYYDDWTYKVEVEYLNGDFASQGD